MRDLFEIDQVKRKFYFGDRKCPICKQTAFPDGNRENSFDASLPKTQ